MRNIVFGLFMCACLVSLSGCGIKPGQVSAPDGEAAPQFPRTYPDISHDPQPKAQ